MLILFFVSSVCSLFWFWLCYARVVTTPHEKPYISHSRKSPVSVENAVVYGVMVFSAAPSVTSVGLRTPARHDLLDPTLCAASSIKIRFALVLPLSRSSPETHCQPAHHYPHKLFLLIKSLHYRRERVARSFPLTGAMHTAPHPGHHS